VWADKGKRKGGGYVKEKGRKRKNKGQFKI
jgi:hypothetical protein